MTKRWEIIIVISILAALAIVYPRQVAAANQDFQDAPVEYYDMNAQVVFGDDILMDFTMKGYAIEVNKAEVLTYESFLEKYQAEDEYTFVPEKLYEITVTLKNIDAEDSGGVNLADFYIQNGPIVASLDSSLYSTANPAMNGATAIALRKGTEMEIHMPFALWEDNFRASTWARLDEIEMNFVATLYPVKKVVGLKAE